MTSVKRYAVYFTPPEKHPLTQAAQAWLGRSAFGNDVADLPAAMATDEQRSWTASPRRYGFHATMKPPFRLADGLDETLLLGAFERFCLQHSGSGPVQLKIDRIGPFIALVAVQAVPGLNALAGSSVEWFEPFRAPLSKADIERRNPVRLTERQRNYLMRWGYPYVFDEFRFHMTLTGPVEADDRSSVQAALEAHFAELIREPVNIDSLALFEETKPGGAFEVLAWGKLKGTEAGMMTA